MKRVLLFVVLFAIGVGIGEYVKSKRSHDPNCTDVECLAKRYASQFNTGNAEYIIPVIATLSDGLVAELTLHIRTDAIVTEQQWIEIIAPARRILSEFASTEIRPRTMDIIERVKISTMLELDDLEIDGKIAMFTFQLDATAPVTKGPNESGN